MPTTLFYTRSDSLGPEEVIGVRLMQSYWNSLPDGNGAPATYAFVNRGVFLTLDDSPVLESLRRLESAGSRVLSCGTCLDYFGVKDRLAVGEVGTMAGLQELMHAADKVITL